MNEHRRTGAPHVSVSMPGPTSAPLVLSTGLLLLAAGAAMNVAFAAVGGLLAVAGLGMWIANLLPGRGHVHEPARAEDLPPPVQARPGTVEQLRPGMAGYRMRLPTETHSLSSGVLGGVVGGLVMPLAPLLYCIASGRSVWYPLNLLAGAAMPGVDQLSATQLEQFDPTLALFGAAVHLAMSVVFGLVYGVLLPTLPEIKKPIAWAALLMPVLWTGLTYPLMERVNPRLAQGVDWPSFVASQFVFGVVVAAVYLSLGDRTAAPVRGLLGGAAGALLMPLPAWIWTLYHGKGFWHPANLLAAMARSDMASLAESELSGFRGDWLATAVAIHLGVSLSFGLAFGLVEGRLPRIPGPLAWGGLLLPVLWTATSYGLMGVVNPLLARSVDWPWFIASQFVFGVVAALVVLRSVPIAVPPAGPGPQSPPAPQP